MIAEVLLVISQDVTTELILGSAGCYEISCCGETP